MGEVAWPSSTPLERDRSLQLARHLCREIKRKLDIIRDPKYTEMAPGMAIVLQEMLDFHAKEIERLGKIKFVRKPVEDDIYDFNRKSYEE